MVKEGYDKTKTTRVVIGYFDSNGNFVPVSSGFPLPISGKIEVTAGGVPVILSRDDVLVTSEHEVTIANKDNMFDKNYNTYGTVEMGASGEFIIALKRPMALNGILFIQSPDNAWSSNNFTYFINYTDGSKDTGTVSSIEDIGSFIPTDPTKRVISFGVKAPSTLETTVSSNIYEIQAFVVMQTNFGAKVSDHKALYTHVMKSDGSIVDQFGADPVGLKDTSGNQINPATEETLNNIKTAANNINSHQTNIETYTHYLIGVNSSLGKLACNYTTTPLSAGGTWEAYATVSNGSTYVNYYLTKARCIIFTDVPGTVKLWLDFGDKPVIPPIKVINGTINDDGTISISGGKPVLIIWEFPIKIGSTGSTIYIKYINGSEAQSYFTLMNSYENW